MDIPFYLLLIVRFLLIGKRMFDIVGADNTSVIMTGVLHLGLPCKAFNMCCQVRLHEHRHVSPAANRVRAMLLPCLPPPPNVAGDHHASCCEGASRPPAALPCCLVVLSQHVALPLAFLTWRSWLTSMMSRLHIDSRRLYKSLFQQQSILSPTNPFRVTITHFHFPHLITKNIPAHA